MDINDMNRGIALLEAGGCRMLADILRGHFIDYLQSQKMNQMEILEYIAYCDSCKFIGRMIPEPDEFLAMVRDRDAKLERERAGSDIA